MGRLISFDEDFKFVGRRPAFAPDEARGFFLNPEWFFEKKVKSRGYSYHEAWDIEYNFPTKIGIHFDTLRLHRPNEEEVGRRIKIEVRKFVERTLTTDVIWRLEASNYFLLYPPDTSTLHSKAIISEVHHGYMMLYFETPAEALLFKLRFAEIVGEITADHPEYPTPNGVLRADTRIEAAVLARDRFHSYIT